jgi:hypothetical protein
MGVAWIFSKAGQPENLLIRLRISRVRTSLQSCVSLYQRTGNATNPIQLCISIFCLLTFQNGGIFRKCHGGGGRYWLTVALPAPIFLMHVVNLYIQCLKENVVVVNSCLGATGWNILSGWPRDLHVAEIIKTSFSGKNSLCLVACAFSPARTQTSFAHQIPASRLSEPRDGYSTRSERLDCGTQSWIVVATAGMGLQ